MNHRIIPAAVLAAFSFGAVLLGPVAPARACDCDVPGVKESIEQAAAIFSGEVVKLERLKDQSLRATIKVASAWKGEVGKSVEVTTAPDGGVCGYDFREGESYLVYARKERDSDDLTTDICTRTRTLREAEEDLKALGEAVANANR